MPTYTPNPEWKDLPFARPRAWGSGRDGKGVRYIVVHYTAGSEGRTSAENGATYDQSRTDGTSCHYFVDSDSVVQCVETWNRSNSALHKGNRLGIQYELCGTVQTRAQWLDPVSDATITNAARQMARDCAKYGIPVRRLTVAETRSCWYSYPSGPKGFVGHVDVTNAYPEDNGDHTDPGTQFPWDVLLERVQQFVSGGDMAAISSEDPSWQDLIFRVKDLHENTDKQPGWPVGVAATNGNKAAHQALSAKVDVLTAKVDQILTILGSVGAGGGLTYEQTVQAAKEGANLAEDS